MSAAVGEALFRVVTEHGVDIDYATLPDRYRTAAESLRRQYAVDAAYNDLAYDRDDEREQIDTYADALREPGEDSRLPAWNDAPISPEAVAEAAAADLVAATSGESTTTE